MRIKVFVIVILSVQAFIWQIEVNAQKLPIKFGKSDRSDLEMLVYPNDSNAHAVILSDYGKTFFQFPDVKVISQIEHESKGFEIIFYRHLKIKILDSTAFHWADVEIPIYHTALAREVVSKLDASTYNLVNGKIEKTKMAKDSIFTEEVDKNWDKIKFSLPDIKEGSVFEVKYTLTSEFLYNLPSWQFQYTIPVIRSEYEVIIPEYYQYNQTQKGYIPIKTEREKGTNKIMLTYQQKPQGLTVRVATHTRDVEFNEERYHYLAENVEAFPIEEYLTTADNYITKIEFELASTKFTNQADELHTNTWGTINRILLEDEDFGLQLSGTGFLKADATMLASEYPDQVQRMNAAFDFIKHKLEWNGKFGKYTSAPLDRIYEQGKGNVADINLLLVCFLKESGINSAPVILSTRDNGFIYPSQASLSRINYVVASAMINGDNYLMDATDPFSDINFLPPGCLNGEGLIIDDKSCGWIELTGKQFSTVQKKYELDLDKDGKFTGTINNERTGYSAYNFRKDVKTCSDESAYLIKMQENLPDLRITEYKFTNLDSLYLPVLDEYNCTINGQCEKVGDLMLFSPLLDNAIGDNLFKLLEREYPVELNYPVSEQFIIQVTIPEGYKIESIPSPLQNALPGNTADFYYKVITLEDRIICTSKMDINKILFMPGEYADLKHFFSTVISKQAEKVVLKKISTSNAGNRP